MALLDKYLLSDAKEKVCFHCKKNPVVKGKGTCAGCTKELESWRNKRRGVKE